MSKELNNKRKRFKTGISFLWLEANFRKGSPADASREVVQRFARAYALYVLGGMVFTDGTGDHVSWIWLQLLSDWEQAGQFSWESATLAWLYRQLCEACRHSKDKSNIGGCIILLQVWTWAHLPVCSRPVPAKEHDLSLYAQYHVGPTYLEVFLRGKNLIGNAQLSYQVNIRHLNVLTHTQVD